MVAYIVGTRGRKAAGAGRNETEAQREGGGGLDKDRLAVDKSHYGFVVVVVVCARPQPTSFQKQVVPELPDVFLAASVLSSISITDRNTVALGGRYASFFFGSDTMEDERARHHGGSAARHDGLPFRGAILCFSRLSDACRETEDTVVAHFV